MKILMFVLVVNGVSVSTLPTETECRKLGYQLDNRTMISPYSGRIAFEFKCVPREIAVR